MKYLILLFISLDLLACRPCNVNWGVEKSAKKADLIAVARRIDPDMRELISPVGPQQIRVQIIDILKGSESRMFVNIKSFYHECPYGIDIGAAPQLVFLKEKGLEYDSLNGGCAVKSLPIIKEQGIYIPKLWIRSGKELITLEDFKKTIQKVSKTY